MTAFTEAAGLPGGVRWGANVRGYLQLATYVYKVCRDPVVKGGSAMVAPVPHPTIARDYCLAPARDHLALPVDHRERLPAEAGRPDADGRAARGGAALLQAGGTVLHPVGVRRRRLPLRSQPDPPQLPPPGRWPGAAGVPRPARLPAGARQPPGRLVAAVRIPRPARPTAEQEDRRPPGALPDRTARGDHRHGRGRGLPLLGSARPATRPGLRAAVRGGTLTRAGDRAARH